MTDVRGIVILEGADGVGKTTLARALCATHSGLYLHGRYFPVNPFKYHLAMLRIAARESQHRLVVIDRHWISNSVYSRVFNETDGYGALARMFYRVFFRFGALYVICAPPTPVVEENFTRLKGLRKEQYTGQMGEVNDRYLRLWTGEDDVSPLAGEDYVDQLTRVGMVHRPTRWMHYDYRYFEQQQGLKRICEAIVWKLGALRRGTWATGLDYDNWNFAGNGLGKVLLVGDHLNEGDGRRGVWWPFISSTPSSVRLTQALHELSIDEDDLAFENTTDPGFSIPLFPKVMPRIIALGNNAVAGLKSVSVEPNAILRHPRSAGRGREYEPELCAALGSEVTQL